MFIDIAGITGAAKTRPAPTLGGDWVLDVPHEPVTVNEYPANFYRETERYRFAMRVTCSIGVFGNTRRTSDANVVGRRTARHESTIFHPHTA